MLGAKPAFVHIGLPRTGTTALQRNFFPACPGTRYGGKFAVSANALVPAVTDLDDAAWDERLPRTLVEAAQLFGGPEERVVVSDEELSVGSLDGAADAGTIARRLHLLFPRATVVAVLRSQLTLLPSLYGYDMARPGTPVATFDGWIGRLRRSPANPRGLHLFDYGRLLDCYLEVFGADRVAVLCHEDMRADYPSFAASLASAIGVDPDLAARLPNRIVNARPTQWTVRARGLSAALPGPARQVLGTLTARGPALDTSLGEDNLGFLFDYYAPGNRRAQERTGVDLAGRGYPV